MRQLALQLEEVMKVDALANPAEQGSSINPMYEELWSP